MLLSQDMTLSDIFPFWFQDAVERWEESLGRCVSADTEAEIRTAPAAGLTRRRLPVYGPPVPFLSSFLVENWPVRGVVASKFLVQGELASKV